MLKMGMETYIFFSQVSDMKAEYFPPKVEIFLQNEIPTDFYILVSGAVVCIPLFLLFFCSCKFHDLMQTLKAWMVL